jgi:chromosome segregation ATPase
MADKMDVDNPNTATSRDPRLTSRNKPPPARTASLDTGIASSPNGIKLGVRKPNNSPPIDRQDAATGDQFIRALSDLIKAAVDTATREVEKDKLRKKKETTEGLLRKAKATPSFPSTTAFFQQARKDEDSELTRMDETITEHQAHYRQLENSLTTKWMPLRLRNNSDADEKISKLQDEIQALRKRVGDSESDASRDKYQSLESKIKILQDRVILLEKASSNHATSINSQMTYGKEIKERVDKLSSDFAQFPPQGTIPTHFSSEVDELKRLTTTLDAKLSSLQKAQEEYSSSLQRVNKTMDAHQNLLNAGNDTSITFEKKFKEIHDRLAPIENVTVTPPEAPTTVPTDVSHIELRLKNVESSLFSIPRPDSSLQSRVQSLSEKLDQLQTLQSMKDEFHFAELAEIKETVNKADIQSLKDGYSRLAEETRQISQSDRAEIQSLKDSFSRLEEETRRIRQSDPTAAVDKAEIQSLKDSFSRLEEETRRIRQSDPTAAVDKAEIQSLKDSFSRLEEETQRIRQSDPTAAVDKAEIQSLKDSFSRLEEETRRIRQSDPGAAVDKAEIQTLKNGLWSLAQEIQKLSVHQINTIDVKVNTVEEALKSSNRLLESVRVGLHSLETRYNHLSTETVVKNMVVAMQEMYPSAGQLAEQITTLKTQAEKEISSLEKTIEQLVQAQNGQKTLVDRLQGDVGQRSADVTHLRETFGKLAIQVSALTGQLEGARAVPEKLQQLHANFDSLTEQYREHVAEIKDRINAKEAADGRNRIELDESFRELKDQVQNLSSGLNQMKTAMNDNQMKIAMNEIASNKKHLQSIDDRLNHVKVTMNEFASNKKDLQSLDERFRRFQESVSTDHRDLSEQIEALKDSLESHQSTVQAPDSLPESVVQSPKLEESPTGSDVPLLPNYAEMAEANPALALREKKKKKKRPRPSTLSDDENERSSGARNESPRTFSSPALDNENASPSESRRKSKKKKKRRLITEGPITID